MYFNIVDFIKLSGAWHGPVSVGTRGTLTANLTQNGSAVGGTISLPNSCFSSGTVEGTIDAYKVGLNKYEVTLFLTFEGGQKIGFSGFANLSGSAIEGELSTLVSGPCAGLLFGHLALSR